MKANAKVGTRNSEWMTVRLGDVVELNPRGGMAELSDESIVGFVPMSAVCEKRKEITAPEVRKFGDVRKGYTPMKNGDLIIAKITPCFENGKLALVNLDHAASFGSTEFHVMRPTGEVESRLLYHLLSSELIQAEGRIQMKGAAGQKRVPADFFRAFEFRVPRSLPEQKRLAKILDKADGVRRKLQQSLRLSDDFLRSVFLDMFGDPVTNPKGWPEEPMSELMSDSKIGLVRASDQFGWDMPVPYVRMDALTRDGAFLPEKVQGTHATVTEVASYSLKPGDLLFNTRNSKELVGKVAIYPGPEGTTFNNNLMRIRFRKGIDPYVIWAQFQFPRVQRELEARKQGTTSVFAVYGKNLATLSFLVPPSDLQRNYRKVVDKVSTSRLKMMSLLAQSESAFSSLQQRAFRGEL